MAELATIWPIDLRIVWYWFID